jgi:hypothetical protein
MTVTNTQAYFSVKVIMTVKSFTIEALECLPLVVTSNIVYYYHPSLTLAGKAMSLRPSGATPNGRLLALPTNINRLEVNDSGKHKHSSLLLCESDCESKKFHNGGSRVFATICHF